MGQMSERWSDEQLDAIQREQGVGIPVAYIRELLSAFQSEGELMDDVPLAVALWSDFSDSYCAWWLIPDKSMMGNFAGWLINSKHIKEAK